MSQPLIRHRNPPWTYEELTLALDLYFRRGVPDDRDRDVVELSQLLNQMRPQGTVADARRFRNPNGVVMKLANFRSRERPGRGLIHGNRLESVVWKRFVDDRELLAAEVARVRQQSTMIYQDDRRSKPVFGFLQPFREKADREYELTIRSSTRVQTRRHETLVNEFAAWLLANGRSPLRNRAIDLGVSEPPAIVEAKEVKSWPSAVREAVGQLYEYRYFQIVPPDTALVFLASEQVPDLWLTYLEEDRGVAVAWRGQDGFILSDQAMRALGVRRERR